MSGFVYVMSNPAMPKMVKVGMTTRTIEARARELHTTGVPLPFVVEAAIWCDDPLDTETAVHDHLLMCNHRVSESREFFYGDDIIEQAKVALFTEAHLAAGYTIAHQDLVIDEACVMKYAQMAGVPSDMVTAVIWKITEDAWQDASAAYRNHKRKHVKLEQPKITGVNQ